MKYLLILAIVFVSLCVGLPIELTQFWQIPVTPQPGVSVIDGTDVYLSIQTIPLEVKSGRTLTLIFEIMNKNNFDLTGLEVRAYDPCIFEGKTVEDIGTLSPNQTKTWTWEWNTGSTELEKDCEIKFKIEYGGEFSLFQDVVVLSRVEYRIRQLEGTLQNIPIQTYSSKTPLDITLTFPETQPFLEDTSGYSMHIDYYNIGNGFITVNKGAIDIGISGNIKDLNCGNYFTPADENLIFIKNKALRTTCNFNTRPTSGPIDIASLSIAADYTYVLDDSISVRVKPS